MTVELTFENLYLPQFFIPICVAKVQRRLGREGGEGWKGGGGGGGRERESARKGEMEREKGETGKERV